MHKSNLLAATAMVAVLLSGAAFAQSPNVPAPRPPVVQTPPLQQQTPPPTSPSPTGPGELDEELEDDPQTTIRPPSSTTVPTNPPTGPGITSPGTTTPGPTAPGATTPGGVGQPGVGSGAPAGTTTPAPMGQPSMTPSPTTPGSTLSPGGASPTTPGARQPAPASPYGTQAVPSQSAPGMTTPGGTGPSMMSPPPGSSTAPQTYPAPAYSPPPPPTTYSPPSSSRPPTAQPSNRSSGLFGRGRNDDNRNPGPYWRVDAGLGFAGDVEFDANVTGPEGTGSLPFSSDSDLDLGWQASAAIGFEEFPLPNWRTELEALYLNNETDDSADNFDDIFDAGDDEDDDDSASADLTVTGGFANLIYDFEFDTPYSLYLGAGVGYGQIEVEYDGATGDDEVFLWQIRAGLGYELSENTVLDLGYRFIDAESAAFEDDGIDLDVSGEVDVAVHALTAGLRYRF